jgi:KUP system potassium uptake protein
VAQASWRQTLQLAFQSIGVVYGDVGTSPLYVYSSTFPHGIKHRVDLLGVLSLILYTFILLAMLKYVFIVLYANDNGDGEVPNDILRLDPWLVCCLAMTLRRKVWQIIKYSCDIGPVFLGAGGTFALYSLISRYAKIRMIPNQQAEDASVSNYSIQEPNSQMRRAQWVKQKLESSNAAKIALFTITILGTAMVMGDGTLTPAISGIDKHD